MKKRLTGALCLLVFVACGQQTEAPLTSGIELTNMDTSVRPQDDFFRKMVAKARDGLNHSASMTLGTYGSNLQAKAESAERIQANCILCHEEAVSQMLANAQLYETTTADTSGRPCWDCHREIPHGTTKSMTTSQDNLGVKEL